MKSLSALALAGTLILSSAPARADLAAGKYTKVYKGPEGLKVTVVHLRPAEEKVALIKFTGVEHPLDGHVLLYSIESSDPKRTYYSTLFDGKRWTPYSIAVDWGSHRSHSFSLGGRAKMSLSYHESESKRIDGRALLEEYRRQVKSGQIKKLQGLSKGARKKLVRHELRDHCQYLKRDCAFKPTVKVDWTTVKDQQLYFMDLSRACSRVVDAVSALCGESDFDLKARVQAIRCHFGDKLKVGLAGKKLDVTIPLGAEGLKDKVQAIVKR